MSDTKELLRDARDRIAPPHDVIGGLERRRQRKATIRRVSAAVVGVIIALAAFGGWFLARAPETDIPAGEPDRGIFTSVSGWIAFEESRLHRRFIAAVDPGSGKVRFVSEEWGAPIAWSADGTSLLLQRELWRPSRPSRFELAVLHADGSASIAVTDLESYSGGTLSPDGRTVVFATPEGGLYRVDALGGTPDLLLARQSRPIGDLGVIEQTQIFAPAFSPDGARIAYVDGMDDHSNEVWVVAADGTDAHRIVELADPPAQGNASHIFGLRWSPTGDRIALGLRGSSTAIYTFAPDGSDVRMVLPDAIFPTWSPDGRRIAFVPTNDAPAIFKGYGFAYAPLTTANTDGSNVTVLERPRRDDEAAYLGYVHSATGGAWHPGSRAGA